MKINSTLRNCGVVLLSLITVFASAWALRDAEAETLGTAANPIIIADSADWVAFADNVNAGINADKYYRLDADINVTKMVGTTEHKFSGFFNGNGHTMNVDLSSSSQGCGPFRFVEGCTITMLHITGKVKAGSSTSNSMNMDRGGFIGISYGDVTIVNCWSSVTIDSELSGDGTHGGFVGLVDNGKFAMVNCLFDGKILGSTTNSCGGFVGWHSAPISIENSVFAPAEITVSPSGSATFSRNGLNPVNCYYTQTLGDVQGIAIGEMSNDDLLAALGSAWQIVDDKVVPCMSKNNLKTSVLTDLDSYYLYTGQPLTLNYTLTAADGKVLVENVDYTTTISPTAEVQECGEYTITFKGIGEYTDSLKKNFIVGEGIEVTSSTTTMKSGYYRVKSNVTVSSRINLEGEVQLILDKNCTLTASKGIEVGISSSLTIDGEGTLNATGNSSSAGIGSYNVGTIIINGGNINAQGGQSGAGIGGSLHDINGGTIIINGGVVKATGGNGAAGIGGGNNNWAGNYGQCGKVVINGGQVTAVGGSNGSGFGPGNSAGTSGEIILSWTNEDDFIYTNSISSKTKSIGFAEGKEFFVEEIRELANRNNMVGKKIIPMTNGSDLRYAKLSFNKRSFLYTGQDIDVKYEVKDVYGNVLEKDTHFTALFTPSDPKEVGLYKLLLTGKGDYVGTLTDSIEVLQPLNGKGTHDEPYTIATTEEWNKFAEIVSNGYSFIGEYVKLTDDITISTMVGMRDNCPFSGTFDGNHHVITANLKNTESSTDKNVQGVAPFHYIYCATIKNLTVAGDIQSSSYHTAGIVGFAGGPQSLTEGNVIDSCVVTATLTIGNDYAGGIVGHGQVDPNISTLTKISNTIFAGTIKSDNPLIRYNVGGIWGWGTSNPVISNCLEKGTYINIDSFNPRGLCGQNRGSATNLYYFNDIKGSPINSSAVDERNGCFKVYDTIQDDNIGKKVSLNDSTFYVYAILSGMQSTYFYNGGNQINLGYSLTVNGNPLTEGVDFDVIIKDSTNQVVLPEDVKTPGTSFTITFVAKEDTEAGLKGSITREFDIAPVEVYLDSRSSSNSNEIAQYDGLLSNVNIYGLTLKKNCEWHTICLPFDVIIEDSPLKGATVKTLDDATFVGSKIGMTLGNSVSMIKAGTPYFIKWDEAADIVINSTDDWNAFADSVNNGETFYGRVVRLNKDITVSKMVGNSNTRFMGYFSGDGHTLTLDSLKSNDANCAPFCAVEDATIANLHTAGVIVAGSDTEKDKYRAGIVAETYGVTSISNCISSVTIVSDLSGDGTHGGIVGKNESGTTTIENCLFNGSILGENTHSCGGIVGWTQSYTIINNCLFNPDSISLKNEGNSTFSRNEFYVSVNDSYYSVALGTIDGTAINDLTVSDLAERLGNGWKVEDDKVVPIMNKYTKTLSDCVFNNVIIDKTDRRVSVLADKLQFVGNYDKFTGVPFNNADLYVIADDSKLFQNEGQLTVNAFQSYIMIMDEARTASDIILDFGNGFVTTIEDLRLSEKEPLQNSQYSEWYSLDGVKLDGKPTKKGMYILVSKDTKNKSMKVVIK